MTTWLVIGIMRSGTSLISSILHKGGVSMGTRFQSPHPAFQPNGFWEDLDFLEINEKILSHFNYNAGAGMLINQRPKSVEVMQVAARYEDEMVSLIKDRTQDDWGFKDPRLITTYPAWQPYLPINTKILWVYRKPENVLRSLAKTAKFTRQSAKQFIDTVKYYVDYLPQILPSYSMIDFDLLRQKDNYQLSKFEEVTGISQRVVMECIK